MYIRLSDGTKFYFDEPVLPSIHVIANSLVKLNRFTGHTYHPWTVGQHSLAMARSNYLKTNKERKWALMHDCAEAVIGDIAAPFKRWIDGRTGGAIRNLEIHLLAQAQERYNLGPYPETVSKLDKAMGEYEASKLIVGWEPGDTPFYDEQVLLAIKQHPPYIGEDEWDYVADIFMDMFHDYSCPD